MYYVHYVTWTLCFINFINSYEILYFALFKDVDHETYLLKLDQE